MSSEDDKVTLTTAQLRENLGEALGRAYFAGKTTHVTNHGKPWAAIVSPTEAEKLRGIKSALTTEQYKDFSESLKALADKNRSR